MYSMQPQQNFYAVTFEEMKPSYLTSDCSEVSIQRVLLLSRESTWILQKEGEGADFSAIRNGGNRERHILNFKCIFLL